MSKANDKRSQLFFLQASSSKERDTCANMHEETMISNGNNKSSKQQRLLYTLVFSPPFFLVKCWRRKIMFKFLANYEKRPRCIYSLSKLYLSLYGDKCDHFRSDRDLQSQCCLTAGQIGFSHIVIVSTSHHVFWPSCAHTQFLYTSYIFIYLSLLLIGELMNIRLIIRQYELSQQMHTMR